MLTTQMANTSCPLPGTRYKSKADWNSDVILMFDNCETFNEDESPVGRAGHNLRSFFDKRWKDMFDKSA